jgi:hypothetical protein
MDQSAKPERDDVLRVACAAVCDRRTVRRYFEGRPVTASTAVRIQRALRELKLETPVSVDSTN